MLEQVPRELSDEWVALTPAKRMGEAYELKGVSSIRCPAVLQKQD